ncbi:hypothetical protein ACFOWM_09590 [Ferruginibacter yonginensis]|uniref:DUF2007 domain-containing protein n=1 Tax=Ferruginibacter yonginensis TaxID=1310416 RepID=A0ABV8QSF0_9BACT
METTILRSFDNYFSANIIVSRLREDGIDAFLKDEFTVTIDPLISNAIGGIKLVVPLYDAEKAVHLLQRYDDEYLQTIPCPECSQKKLMSFETIVTNNWLINILSKLFSTKTIQTATIYKCEGCGFSSDIKPVPVHFNEDDATQ